MESLHDLYWMSELHVETDDIRIETSNGRSRHLGVGTPMYVIYLLFDGIRLEFFIRKRRGVSLSATNIF